ncbi:hypothetical protein BVX99_01725 [bacterium F16]|nr:hypothetical protein BVX99_01725 [bacterium F16]
MIKLMTKEFSKWSGKQKLADNALGNALNEVIDGFFEANLGGNLYKKRIAFQGRGKSGSGRTIICLKRGEMAVYLYGFGKNEKDSLSPKELKAFKTFAKVLLNLTNEQIQTAINNGDLTEVIL